MSEWQTTTIGEHCTVTSSKRFHLSERATEGVPFYCSKEIIQKTKGEEVTICDYITEELYDSVKNRFGVPESGDLLITTRGTYGVPYIYRESDKFYFADGNLTWLKDFDEKLLAKYLYYWILSHEGQSKIDAIAKGTAQKAVPIASIKELKFQLPPVEVQERISGILSAYDNLIENNQKQIRLLEEAARRLYKEWFVDFRFPGHESVTITDGVPQGWRQGTLSEISTFKRGKTITKEQAQKGTIPVVAGGLSPAYYHNEANTVAPVITVSGSGANAGFTRLYHVNVFASDCSFADSASTPYVYYAYCFLKENEAQINALQKGSAQPHVYAKDLNALKLYIPDVKILESYIQAVEAYFKKIAVLERQMNIATEARNRLLPVLMSGEMGVLANEG